MFSVLKLLRNTSVKPIFTEPIFALSYVRQSTAGESAEIQSSIDFFLNRHRQSVTLLEREKRKYELGRLYLAKMMGADPKSFEKEAIDEAIRYLFPSGLFGKNARPKFKPPEEIFPRQRNISFDSTGRPIHHLFYTGLPGYFEITHKAAAILNKLNRTQDIMAKITNESKFEHGSSVWFTKKELETLINEDISEKHYKDWQLLMQRILDHPLSAYAKNFLINYRNKLDNIQLDEEWPKPQIDPLNSNRTFVEAYGQRKRSLAEVRLYMPGTGQIRVNGNSLLDEFPCFGNREQIMMPILFTDKLGAIDIDATVSLGGEASRAGALRLAISRAIAAFIKATPLSPENSSEEGQDQLAISDLDRLRIAGLLTQDNRFAQRKQPGQKGARKKPIWKAR